MSVNQKIIELLKHGDLKRIADLLGDSHQNVSRKIKSKEKDVDNVWLLLAVSKVTGKPIEYFLTDNNEHSSLLNEPIIKYGYDSQQDLINKNKSLESELNEMKETVRELQSELLVHLKKK